MSTNKTETKSVGTASHRNIDLNDDGEKEVSFLASNLEGETRLLIYSNNFEDKIDILLPNLNHNNDYILSLIEDVNTDTPIFAIQSKDHLYKIKYYMFAKENKDDTQYYFGRFASLIHRGLEYADKVETSLDEELKFIKDYLILQKRRFNDDLLFVIEADDDIDLTIIKIPHSLILTFVENAIKHGLHHKTNNKQLKIFVNKNNAKITITITDNGIGRKQSVRLKTTGIGKRTWYSC